MGANVSGLRLRSVKFKDGRKIEVLRRDSRHFRADFLAFCRNTVDLQGDDFVGFALVVWGSDQSSTAECMVSQGSCIPTILVPDFVKNRLLAERIERWTREGLKEQ